MKTAARLEARRLREEQGRSIKEIARLLRVSQGSVSIWVRDIELTLPQREALAARNPALTPEFNGSRVRAARALEERLRYQAEGRSLARQADVDFAAGCMLFWAEGSRRRNAAILTNSDPAMLAFFMRFLRRYLGVRDDAVAVWCNLFADHAERQWEIEQFWLETLELPRTALRKSTINRYSPYSKKVRQNVLPYGTCRVTVHRTRVVQMLYGAIQELAGFERESWAL